MASANRPDPLSLLDYLDRVEDLLRRYVAFGSVHEPAAIALWTAHAWLIERFDVSPILGITSAERRSGKSRTLDVLELVVPQPFRAIIPSAAVIFTLLGRKPRHTLLIDEADPIFDTRNNRYDDLRAVLNAGHRRGSGVPRTVLDGRRRDVAYFEVFGAKAIAGIGDLPDTVADRAVLIRLKRRSADEAVTRFRYKSAQSEVADLVVDWDSVTLVSDVTTPEELHDRAADSWEPLLAIADTAGGSWPRRGRAAAIALTARDESMSIGLRLLGDIRLLLLDQSHLETPKLIAGLVRLEHAPWADWYGKQITPQALARLLAPYGVKPRLRRVSGPPIRAYFATDLLDAFRRYLPPLADTPVTDIGEPVDEPDYEEMARHVFHDELQESGE